MQTSNAEERRLFDGASPAVLSVVAFACAPLLPTLAAYASHITESTALASVTLTTEKGKREQQPLITEQARNLQTSTFTRMA